MKAKKIVIGAVSAAMLSLSVCSIAPVFAAGETVQISVGKISANAGETFSVDVSISNIPSNGIQCCDFAIKYDSSLMTINSVEAGELANTNAVKDDPSTEILSIFGSSIDDKTNLVSLSWSTSLDDPSYWMNDGGVFCTISGTLSADAKGTIPLEVVPSSRNTYPGSNVQMEMISCGYFKGKDVIRYDVKVTDGEINVDGGSSSKPIGDKVKGDANEDGDVNVSDAVLIMQSLSNPDEYKLTKQGIINADVIGDDGVTAMDALEIQKMGIGLPSVFD
ncbi:MAG: hypothetical protein K2K66_09250 [Ruminococcus sp.]|nr:hypothetical protein [Ruminococcus sp.]